MRQRHLVGLALVLVVAAAACSSRAHRGAASTTTTTSSTVPGASNPSTPPTVATTATTRPTSQPSGCLAPDNREANSVRTNAWVQMVSSKVGYAVIGHAVVGTVDGVHWKSLYLSPESLSFVDAVDANHVWALGSRSLFTSVDGGRNWTVSPKSAVPLSTVHFVGANDGWSVTDGMLLQTSTGGHAWQAAPSPCPVDRVCFDNAQHGWIVTGSRAYKTDDGGAHWSPALSAGTGSSLGGDVIDVQCTSDNSAWILFDNHEGAGGHISYAGYRCRQDGACALVIRNNFYPPVVPGTDGPGASPGPFSVIDDHTAVFTGYTSALQEPMSMVLLSDDGRTRGPALVVPDGPPEQATPAAVSFTSRERGWIVDTLNGAAHIIATTNGGRTWSVQYAVPFP